MREYLKNIKVISIAALVGLPLAACTSTPVIVQSGDKAEINFTCRLSNGELAATTRPDASVSGEVKSPLYLARGGADETVAVTAGPQAPAAAKQDRQPFEQEIIARLAPGIPGLKVGEQVQRSIEAERYPVASPTDKKVKMATTRKRQKEMRLSIEEYTGKKGMKPEVGQKFVLDKLVPGQVTEVTDTEVVIRFAPVEGAELKTPFGPVTVRELADRYELDIAAQVGTLVRTGPMAGRVIAVDKDSLTIDYGHPFAGEKLDCQVKVEKTVAQEQQAAAPPAEVAAKAAPEAPAMELDPKIAAQLETALRAAYGTPNQAATLDGSPVAVAANGDLATVNYTASLEDGSVFYTTSKAVAESATTKKASWFSAPNNFAGEAVPVGKPALFPGVGEALPGMSAGSVKHLSLPPEQAFGPSDPQKIQKLPLVRTMPRTVTVPADEYVKRFNGFPTVGKEVPATPYFSARVTAVRERDVDLLLLAENGTTYNEAFGTTLITVDDANITTALKPVIGSLFPVQNGSAVVTAADADSFTIDMNNPLAGKTVTIDLELTSLTAAAALPTGDLPWFEEHDAGLAQAKKDGKPAVLVLHADWCSFCKKLFNETMPDPRISALRDKFTWVKVNSDKLTEYKLLYEQEGFPMIVLFNADGSIAKKLDGYQEASMLRAVLQDVM
jgi:FKBP-type peptidyl-prolyl cis-trans isomerase 2